MVAFDVDGLAKRMDPLCRDDVPVDLRWAKRPTTRGWHATSPRRDTVTWSEGTGDTRAMNNIKSRLRTAGFFDDEEKLAALLKDRGQQRTAAGRKAADQKAEKLAAQGAAQTSAPLILSALFNPETAKYLTPSGPVTAVPATAVAASNGNASARPVGRPPNPPPVAPTLPPGESWPVAKFTRYSDEPIITDPTDRPKPGTHQITVTELVTPERAFELLNRKPGRLPDGKLLKQRVVADSDVATFVDIINAGDWVVAEDIKLAPEEPVNTGGALNGQHRLTAIFESGKAVPVRITYNTPPEVFDSLDQARKRTFADVLYIDGQTDTNNRASVAKLLYCVRQFQANPTGKYMLPAQWNRQKPTPHELRALSRTDPGIVEHLEAGFAMMKGEVKGIPAAGVVFRILASEAWPEGRDMLDDFCEQVRDGDGLAAKAPANTYRKWIMRGSGPDIPGSKREKQLIAAIRVWGKHVAGETYGLVAGVNLKVPMPALYTPKPAEPKTRSRRTRAGA